jgi:hypothetical protein
MNTDACMLYAAHPPHCGRCRYRACRCGWFPEAYGNRPAVIRKRNRARENRCWRTEYTQETIR